MKNNIHDKIFTCPKCGNDTPISIGKKCYHDICEEYATESESQYDNIDEFIESNKE